MRLHLNASLAYHAQRVLAATHLLHCTTAAAVWLQACMIIICNLNVDMTCNASRRELQVSDKENIDSNMAGSDDE